jgi:hypothetical protein
VTTKTFVYTGAAQNFVIPTGVTSITMELWGGQGGNQPGGGGVPGHGGYLKCTQTVTPGHTLVISVGGKGTQGVKAVGSTGVKFVGGGDGGYATVNTYYQGSGGGGGTFVVDNAGTGTILAAAGGGGASGYSGGGNGGAGGGTTAGNATATNGGKGGSQVAGGAAGSGSANMSFEPPAAGASNSGGNGSVFSGGGGGGGWYGGGGGGSDGANVRAYGGGGGSSYAKSGSTGVVHTIGGSTFGNGQVVLTYNMPPNAPSPQAPTNNTGHDVTQPTIFQWLNSFNETGDAATAFDIQYRIVGASTWTAIPKQTSAGVQYTVAANTFVAGNLYEWQVRSYGQKSGTAGPWSASARFTATAPPAAPTIAHPVTGEIINATAYNIVWTPVIGQQAFRLIIYGDDGTGAKDLTNVIFDSGLVAGDHGGDNLWPVIFATGNYAAHVVLYVVVGGVNSPATDLYITTAINPPQQPVIVATANNASGSITIGILNPTTETWRPVAVSNDIYRSAPGEPEIRVATGVPVNGNWVDYTPASKIVYTYRAVAIAVSGAGASS